MSELLASHEGVLLDAYGVLVDAASALPGAKELIGELERRETPYAIVTNDASRTPATYVQRFTGLGLPVPAAKIVTSGSLLPEYFRSRGLAGSRRAKRQS